MLAKEYCKPHHVATGVYGALSLRLYALKDDLALVLANNPTQAMEVFNKTYPQDDQNEHAFVSVSENLDGIVVFDKKSSLYLCNGKKDETDTGHSLAALLIHKSCPQVIGVSRKWFSLYGHVRTDDRTKLAANTQMRVSVWADDFVTGCLRPPHVPLILFALDGGVAYIAAYTPQEAFEVVLSLNSFIHVNYSLADIARATKSVDISVLNNMRVYNTLDKPFIGLLDLFKTVFKPKILCANSEFIDWVDSLPEQGKLKKQLEDPHKFMPYHDPQKFNKQMADRQAFDAECRQVWARALLVDFVNEYGKHRDKVEYADWAMEQYIKKFGDKTDV